MPELKAQIPNASMTPTAGGGYVLEQSEKTLHTTPDAPETTAIRTAQATATAVATDKPSQGAIAVKTPIAGAPIGGEK